MPTAITIVNVPRRLIVVLPRPVSTAATRPRIASEPFWTRPLPAERWSPAPESWIAVDERLPVSSLAHVGVIMDQRGDG